MLEAGRAKVLADQQRDTGAFLDWIQAIESAWERFISHDAHPAGVKDEVAASWRRSRAKGVDLYRLTQVTLPREQLERRLEENRELIEVAGPILHNLAQNVKGSGFRVDLFDSDLYLMLQFGDEDTLVAILSLPAPALACIKREHPAPCLRRRGVPDSGKA